MGEAIEVLYRDPHLVAVHKPAGVLVHRNPQVRDAGEPLLQRVRRQLRATLYPVHRLDRPTSGVLLFALDPDTARGLAADFMANRVAKHYLAVVRGHTEEAGVVDHALGSKRGLLGAAGSDPAGPRAAITRYRRLATVELAIAVGPYASARYSLVHVQPLTGRMHQIRRHLKHIAHPVIGDTTHGKGDHNRVFREHFGCARLLLAATGLALRHPASGAALTISAPPADCFAAVLERFGWREAMEAHLRELGAG